MVIVIPCYNEPEIKYTIDSVFRNENPGVSVVVAVVVNSSVDSPVAVKEQNSRTIKELLSINTKAPHGYYLKIIEADNLPAKHAGAGWARKIGMDWAVSLFNKNGNDSGIIVSLDADTLVESNYLSSVYGYFKQNTDKVAATIYFEHSTIQSDYGKISEEAIVLYELYMRFYRNAILSIGFPNSIYTVGSCFAVKVLPYIAQGGMNRRKAGEDFYFLHKMTMFGTVGEINSTTVYPSSRISDRVPYGTGPVIKKYCEGDRSIKQTYPLEAFLVLKSFFGDVDKFYLLGAELNNTDLSANEVFVSFAEETDLASEIAELSANCSGSDIFRKRFFDLFNAFRILKWLNYAVLHEYRKEDLVGESRKLLFLNGYEADKIPDDPKLMLNLFRIIDRTRTNN